MSYTPINWQTGDTITAAKLNRCDNGWGYESTQLFSETVTTASSSMGYSATLAYSTPIDTPTLIVTFDGTDYSCQRIDAFGMCFYGGFSESGTDFSEFPFLIQSENGTNSVYTETASTHTVAATAHGIVVSDYFEGAVNACIDTSAMPMQCVDGVTTYDQMAAASGMGKMLYFKDNPNGTRFIYGFTQDASTTAVSFIPESGTAMTAGFDIDMVFTVYYS